MGSSLNFNNFSASKNKQTKRPQTETGQTPQFSNSKLVFYMRDNHEISAGEEVTVLGEIMGC